MHEPPTEIALMIAAGPRGIIQRIVEFIQIEIEDALVPCSAIVRVDAPVRQLLQIG